MSQYGGANNSFGTNKDIELSLHESEKQFNAEKPSNFDVTVFNAD